MYKLKNKERGKSLYKAIDFYLGSAFLYTLGKFRRKHHFQTDFSTVGIFAFAAIGDSILSSIIIHEIKKLKPDSNVIVFVSKSNAGIYNLLDGYDKIVIVPITNPFAAIKLIRRFKVDVLIDTSQWSRISAVLSMFLDAGFSIGFKTQGQYRHYVYNECVEHSNQLHEIENFRSLLWPLGIVSSEYPRVATKISDRDIPLPTDNKYIVFHPWASGTNNPMREWPVLYWSDLAGRLIKNGYDLVITGGPEDWTRGEELKQEVGDIRIVNVAGKLSFTETAAVLREAKCVIAVNTGVMHLAATLDVPLIGLNGPTNPLRWGPLGRNSEAISVSPSQGGAYLNLGFEYPKNPKYLMNQITVDSVIDVLQKRFGLV